MKRIVTTMLLITIALIPFQTLQAVDKGSRIPACRLTSMDGSHPLDLGELRGTVLYVDFWASWCTPCAKAFPFMNQLDRELKHQGLRVVAVNLDEERSDAEKFLARHSANFTVVTDRKFQCAKGFDVQAMPSSYLVDRAGIIRHVHLGFRSSDSEQIRRLVKQLLVAPAQGG